MPTLRLFFAFTLDPIVKQQIVNVSKDLQKLFPGKNIRWVEPQLFHITLKFLGNVEVSKIESIERTINSCNLELPACEVSFGGLGSFPNKFQPRAIWVGAEPDEMMKKVHHSLDNLLAPMGFSREQNAYSPHITLARISDSTNATDKRAIGEMLNRIKLPTFNQQSCDSITLFKSDLQRNGPIYSVINTYPLNVNRAKIRKT